MLDAGIMTIAWFIIKVIVAVFVVILSLWGIVFIIHGVVGSIGSLFSSTTKEPTLSKKEIVEDDYNRRTGIFFLKRTGIITTIMFLYMAVVDYLHPNEPISKTQSTIMLSIMFLGWLWIRITMPKKPTELETELEIKTRELQQAQRKLNKHNMFVLKVKRGEVTVEDVDTLLDGDEALATEIIKKNIKE